MSKGKSKPRFVGKLLTTSGALAAFAGNDGPLTPEQADELCGSLKTAGAKYVTEYE